MAWKSSGHQIDPPSQTPHGFERAGIEDVVFLQQNGTPPETVLALGHTGTEGLRLAHVRFSGAGHVFGTGSHHWMFLHLGGSADLRCEVEKSTSNHVASAGSIAICPAGFECSGQSAGSTEGLLIVIPPEALNMISARNSQPNSLLRAKLFGTDGDLLLIAREILEEASVDGTSRPRAWFDQSHSVLQHLFERYVHKDLKPPRGALPQELLVRLNQYLMAHLDQPIDVDSMADVVAHTRSHFPRIFRRTVGMSPYRYLVLLRVRQATLLLGQGHLSLAEIAVATGFTDQSHMSRWIRAVHGSTPSQLVGPAFIKTLKTQDSARPFS